MVPPTDRDQGEAPPTPDVLEIVNHGSMECIEYPITPPGNYWPCGECEHIWHLEIIGQGAHREWHSSGCSELRGSRKWVDVP